MPAKYQETRLFIWAHHAKKYNNRYCMFGAKTVSKSIKLIELALNNVVVPRAKQIHCRSVFYNFILSWFDLFVLTWHRKGFSMFLSVTVRDCREKMFIIKFLINLVAFLSPLKPKQWFAISQAFQARFLIKLYFLKTDPIVRKAAKIHTWDIKKKILSQYCEANE